MFLMHSVSCVNILMNKVWFNCSEKPLLSKKTFFNTSFMPDVFLQNQAFPVDTSFFNDETQSVISLMNQFLGLDTDKNVIESLMSLLFKITTSQVDSSQYCCLKFDEFVVESIHSQLVNFHNIRFCRF